MPPSDNRDLYRPMTLRALRLHFVLLLGLGTIAPLTESAMFFFLLPHGLIHSSPVRYLFKFILFPTSCLWILLAINYRLRRQKPEALALQARILSYSLVASALVLSVVHTIFPSIFLLFYIALFLTILFDDPALTRRTFFLSLAARCVGSFFSLDATLVRGEYELPNLLISIFCLAGTYLLCVGVLEIEREKRDLILQRGAEWAQMEQNALTDPLTGVGNRRALRQYFDRVLDGSTASPRYLAMLDIDSFKQINDRFGHLEGDGVLKYVGLLLTKTACPMQAFRYGGDEFVLLFHCARREEAFAALQLFQRKAALYTNDQGGKIPISLSVGFSACLPGLSPAELISRADRALYYSKKHCRGKISVYSDIDPFLLKGYTSQNSEINCGIPENEMQKGDAESSQKAHPLG
ncbi:Diguanylate cyclase, GGDEF domain [Ruminococcaceae bacterium D5]|nr:Diguanylate cyclase, GGDEF domain [Ruminococcaceae bacterium D5]